MSTQAFPGHPFWWELVALVVAGAVLFGLVWIADRRWGQNPSKGREE